MALQFNENDRSNIRANKFDKLEHVFSLLDDEKETSEPLEPLEVFNLIFEGGPVNGKN